MARREVLGNMACPECGFPDAEIKLQKCGVKLYRYCPECNSQTFARTAAQEVGMRKHIKSPSVTAPEPEQAPGAPKKTVQEPAATKKPARAADPLSFLFGGTR